MAGVSIQKLYEELKGPMLLELLNEIPTEPIPAVNQDVHRPGMALMGFSDNFLPDRIQVFGESEMAYLYTISPAEQKSAVLRILELEVPAVFVAKDMSVPLAVIELMQKNAVPLFRTSFSAVDLVSGLTRYLERAFSLKTEAHGTLVDVYGVGLLFTGRSGIGKSEVALDLIERGHRLVADDIVEITKYGDDVLIGRYRELLRHNLEIRGVGVIDVQAIFGIRSIRMQKRIEVEVQLQEWDESVDYERVTMENRYTEFLGMNIPQVIVPLFPGKNITVISEVIALNFMLKIYGYDAAKALNERIMAKMRRTSRLRDYLEQDPE